MSPERISSRITDDDTVDTCVDYHSLTHETAAGTAYDRAVSGVGTAHIEGGTEHLISRCGDYGICLGVNGTAKLIPLAAGDLKLIPHAVTEVGAVDSSSGSTVVARGDDSIIFYNNCTVMLSETRAALRYGFGNIKVIIVF